MPDGNSAVSAENLIKQVVQNDRRSLARLITKCEQSQDYLYEVARQVFPRTGNARYIGVTGSFGVGKSTLTARLIASARQRGQKVGVVAVDPRSPFTGGALLGDRIRMNEHALDQGVFIRSLSSTDSSVTPEVIIAGRLMELWGAELVLIETAGTGQTQVDIMSLADLVLLLLQPGTGDEVQLMKAGLMEVADYIVITKTDVLNSAGLKAALERELSGRSIAAVDTLHHRFAEVKINSTTDNNGAGTGDENSGRSGRSCGSSGRGVKSTEKTVKIFETGLSLVKSYDKLFDEINRAKMETGRRRSYRALAQWLMAREFKNEVMIEALADSRLEQAGQANQTPFDISQQLVIEYVKRWLERIPGWSKKTEISGE